MIHMCPKLEYHDARGALDHVQWTWLDGRAVASEGISMTMIDDKSLGILPGGPDEKRDFHIAWLNRRIENLEAIIFELLRDRVHYGAVTGYQKALNEPLLPASSHNLKEWGRMLAEQMQQGWPAENLEWPPAVKVEGNDD